MISIESIQAFHLEATRKWHDKLLDCEPEGIMGPEGIMELICQQHRFNYLLWHEEDVARSPNASDTQIAAVKRSIDSLNQKRNDSTELIDCAIEDYLAAQNIAVLASATLNSETPGSIIDRLSILALRLYHLREQLERAEITAMLRQSIVDKIQIAELQQADLTCCLKQLWEDLCLGRKRHKIYRQLKMYNDPNLNPYLYSQEQKLP